MIRISPLDPSLSRMKNSLLVRGILIFGRFTILPVTSLTTLRHSTSVLGQTTQPPSLHCKLDASTPSPSSFDPPRPFPPTLIFLVVYVSVTRLSFFVFCLPLQHRSTSNLSTHRPTIRKPGTTLNPVEVFVTFR